MRVCVALAGAPSSRQLKTQTLRHDSGLNTSPGLTRQSAETESSAMDWIQTHCLKKLNLDDKNKGQHRKNCKLIAGEIRIFAGNRLNCFIYRTRIIKS